MKTLKFLPFLLLFSLLIYSSTAYAQPGCQPLFQIQVPACSNLIDLSNATFEYPEGVGNEDPGDAEGFATIEALVNEQNLINGLIDGTSNVYPDGNDSRWTDGNEVGIMDIGEEVIIDRIYFTVKCYPAGVFRVTAGQIGTPGYDPTQVLAEIQFPAVQHHNIVSVAVNSVTTRYLTFERLAAPGGGSVMNDVTEIALCGTSANTGVSVSGCVATPCGTPVPNATVRLIDVTNGVSGIFIEQTDATGCYSFDNLTSGRDWYLEIIKIEASDCGVDSDDVGLVERHAASITLITDPYSLIAADVNDNDAVNVGDVVYMNQLIVGDIISFGEVGGEDWVFIEEGFVFLDPSDPFDTEFLNDQIFMNLTSAAVQNFTGIKIGDVDCSYDPSCDGQSSPRRESHPTTRPEASTPKVAFQPNPFRDQLQMEVNLPEDSPVVLSLYDAQGRLLFQERYQMQAGYNQLQLTNVVSAKYQGILFYALESNQHTAQGRLMKF